ncbi:MAG: beta-N-acetylhexosaminidase [Solirubrobacteraceae bacterium]|jgi:beta-N-acetylhexosaminidase|nr:beta-N-acetylhexosaminidase [Solirubrobacteraceae bacterium]
MVGSGDQSGTASHGRSARAASSPPPPGAIDSLPLKQQVGELIILRFDGTTLPAYARRIFARRAAAGAILFRNNVSSPPQLAGLTREVQSAAGGDAIIAADQEGGPVRTVPWAGPANAPATQGDPAAVTRTSRAAAAQLRASGINLDLAPVADVPSVDRAALGPRAFGRDPATVSAGVDAAVRGYAAGGVGTTAKHFPGLGGATANTDDRRVTIGRTARQLNEEDLPPFAAAVRAGVPVVMVGHALYPALDSTHIASQSPAVYALLRSRLGFHGVAITDSLEARAVIGRSSVADAALASLRAGADLLLTTGRGSYIHVYRRLLDEASRSPALRERIREAAGRVSALAQPIRTPTPPR